MHDARFLVLRGTAEGRRYVSCLGREPGVVEWTEDRGAALRFDDGASADRVQCQIVARQGIAVAVVPDLS